MPCRTIRSLTEAIDSRRKPTIHPRGHGQQVLDRHGSPMAILAQGWLGQKGV